MQLRLRHLDQCSAWVKICEVINYGRNKSIGNGPWSAGSQNGSLSRTSHSGRCMPNNKGKGKAKGGKGKSKGKSKAKSKGKGKAGDGNQDDSDGNNHRPSRVLALRLRVC